MGLGWVGGGVTQGWSGEDRGQRQACRQLCSAPKGAFTWGVLFIETSAEHQLSRRLMSLEVAQLGEYTIRPWPTAGGGGVCVYGIHSQAWRENLSRGRTQPQ